LVVFALYGNVTIASETDERRSDPPTRPPPMREVHPTGEEQSARALQEGAGKATQGDRTCGRSSSQANREPHPSKSDDGDIFRLNL
jgi:hypothetical protein